jgi:hypothetical protein
LKAWLYHGSIDEKSWAHTRFGKGIQYYYTVLFPSVEFGIISTLTSLSTYEVLLTEAEVRWHAQKYRAFWSSCETFQDSGTRISLYILQFCHKAPNQKNWLSKIPTLKSSNCIFGFPNNPNGDFLFWWLSLLCYSGTLRLASLCLVRDCICCLLATKLRHIKTDVHFILMFRKLCIIIVLFHFIEKRD